VNIIEDGELIVNYTFTSGSLPQPPAYSVQGGMHVRYWPLTGKAVVDENLVANQNWMSVQCIRLFYGFTRDPPDNSGQDVVAT
jgi:hypothetical protein